MNGCFVDDDGGSVVIAVEDENDEGQHQALWFRVGPVFYGTNDPAPEPGVWIEYQEEYEHSALAGPVLLTPQAWRQAAAAIEERLSAWEEDHGKSCDME